MHRVDAKGLTTGRKIGVVMMIVGPMSMNVPSSSSSDVDQQQDDQRSCRIEVSIQATQRRRDLEKGHQPAKARGRPDDQQHHRGGAHRAHGGVDEILPAHLAIDEDGDEQRVEHSDAGAFGGGEDAGAHAAEDDGDQQQARDGDSSEMRRLGEAGEGLGRDSRAGARRHRP